MAAIGEIDQFVCAGIMGAFLEIDHLHIAVVEGDFGKVKLRFAIDSKEKAVYLDVRDPGEFTAGHLPGAVKRAQLRPRARLDLVDITRWYFEQGGVALSDRFFGAAREAVTAIESNPGIGSPRLGVLTQIEGLRSWPVHRFPVRWFYLERADSVDIVRLLGERQDLEAILRDELPGAT